MRSCEGLTAWGPKGPKPVRRTSASIGAHYQDPCGGPRAARGLGVASPRDVDADGLMASCGPSDGPRRRGARIPTYATVRRFARATGNRLRITAYPA